LLLVGVTDLLVEFPGEREVAGGRGDLDGRVVLLEAEGNVAALAGVAVHPDASYNNARAPLVSRSKRKSAHALTYDGAHRQVLGHEKTLGGAASLQVAPVVQPCQPKHIKSASLLFRC
jgi:hypothetical protein